MTLMMVVVLVLVQSRRTRGGWGGADPTRSLQEQMLDLLLQKALELYSGISAGYTKSHSLPSKTLPFRSKTITKKRELVYSTWTQNIQWPRVP